MENAESNTARMPNSFAISGERKVSRTPKRTIPKEIVDAFTKQG
jgi:hypothetical protein